MPGRQVRTYTATALHCALFPGSGRSAPRSAPGIATVAKTFA